jgi:hypothetical protein
MDCLGQCSTRGSPPSSDAFCVGRREERQKKGSPVKERQSWRELLWLGETTTGRTVMLEAEENRRAPRWRNLGLGEHERLDPGGET